MRINISFVCTRNYRPRAERLITRRVCVMCCEFCTTCSMMYMSYVMLFYSTIQVSALIRDVTHANVARAYDRAYIYTHLFTIMLFSFVMLYERARLSWRLTMSAPLGLARCKV